MTAGAHTLVAGVGNVLLGDDGFGVAVVRRLMQEPDIPAGVSVVDVGIRSLHLAFELLYPRQLLVVVDTVSRGGRPGTLYLLEPPQRDRAGAVANGPHDMDLPAVFTAVRAMGGTLPRVLIVGCEPADLDDGIGLSPAVAGAVDGAIQMVRRQLEPKKETSST